MIPVRQSTAPAVREARCGSRPGIRAQTPPTAVLNGESSRLLDHVHDPGVELIIWERRLPSGLGDWLDRLSIAHLPRGHFLVDEGEPRAAFAWMLDASSTPDDDMRALLLTDLAEVTSRFASLMRAKRVEVRLEAVHHDACWKFHRDCVAARLLTTYRGPGTEWVSPGDSAQALARQKSYGGPIHRFPRHAVGLFKGSCAAPASGIVHRSPPIAGTGTTRLLFCLNLPSSISPLPWAQQTTMGVSPTGRRSTRTRSRG